MADPPTYPYTVDDTGVGHARGASASVPRYPGTPRWVKVSGIVALVLILLVVLVMVASGTQHGPGRHMPPGDAGGNTPPIALGVQWS